MKVVNNRTVIFVIAGNDSGYDDKERADFICDGFNDRDILQHAIDSLPECGGCIEFTKGKFDMRVKEQSPQGQASLSTGDSDEKPGDLIIPEALKKNLQGGVQRREKEDDKDKVE